MQAASNTYMITGVIMRPFNELSEGKDWFINWLKNHHFTDIVDTDTISRYYHWDVEATLNGERYAFELKNRTFPSYQFEDAAVNYDKYEYLLDCPHKAIFVTFWTDCFIMIDVKNCHPDEDIIRQCPHQTRFPDHQIISKKMVRWKIQNMKLLKYDQI